MKRDRLKAKFLGLFLITTASTVGLLAACSPTSQNSSATQNQVSSASEAVSPGMSHGGHGMDHAGMNHAMDLGSADAEYDLRFIDAMIPHHQGAVEMAKAAKQNSKRPEIRTLAEQIIQAQDQEINQMQQWRKAWYPKASSEAVAWHSSMGHSAPMTQEQRQSMMMNTHLGTADDKFDLRFINAMIPHHEGAIAMANDATNKANRPEIKQLTNEIITSQQAEIDQMKQWRKAWYNQ